MRDLNDIIDNNSKAGAADISVQKLAGKFVVATYAGISYLAHSAFDTLAAAQTREAELLANPGLVGERVILLEPTPPAAVLVPGVDTPPTLESLRRAARAEREEAGLAA